MFVSQIPEQDPQHVLRLDAARQTPLCRCPEKFAGGEHSTGENEARVQNGKLQYTGDEGNPGKHQLHPGDSRTRLRGKGTKHTNNLPLEAPPT